MKFVSFFLSVLVLLNKGADAYIEPMTHNIAIITPSTFDSVIKKHRDNFVSCVLFYDDSVDVKATIDGWYNTVATELKGMIKVAGIDCSASRVFCKQQNVTNYPTIMIYPPNPIPAFKYTGTMDNKPLTSQLVRFIPDSNVKTLSIANFQEFVQNQTSMPKVLLFSSRDRAPPLFNALANSFMKEIHFGFVPPSDTEVSFKYNVTKKPAVILVRSGKKNEVFKGKINFTELHDWVNLFRETFVQGGGFSDIGGSTNSVPEEEKPWLNDDLPELTKASSNPVCFKQANSICVMLLTKGDITPGLKNLMLTFKEQLENEKTNTTNYKWMWMNLEKEVEWNKMFNFTVLPTVVLFNPQSKRPRYMAIEGEANSKNLTNLFEKITSGGGRFTVVPGFKIPQFVSPATQKVRDEL